MRRPFTVIGRISMARTHRGSVMPASVMRLSQASCDTAGMVNGSDLMIRSGSFWPKSGAKFQPWSSGQVFSAGMSFGSPCGAPVSIHFSTLAYCSSLSERSFLNFCTPTVLSICHGGMLRASTRDLIERTHGRTSEKVFRDIGAIESGRWQASHFSWKIGAMSLLNVGLFGTSANAAAGVTSAAPSASARTALNLPSNMYELLRGRPPRTRCVRLIIVGLYPRPGTYQNSGGHRHFYVSIGPAALKAAATLTRLIVRLHPQHVLAGI